MKTAIGNTRQIGEYLLKAQYDFFINFGSGLLLGCYLIWERSRAQVAQLVEQWTENPRVGGSIPPLGTTSSVTLRLSY